MNKKDFEIENGKLIKYNGNSKNVIIPDEVTVIGEEVFRNKDIKSVIMSSVVKIEKSAFLGCEYLKNVQFSNTLEEIEDYAFDYCMSLKSINIPKSVKFLGTSAGYKDRTYFLLKLNGGTFFSARYKNLESITFEERNDKLKYEPQSIYICYAEKPLKIILPKHPVEKKYDDYNDTKHLIYISNSYIKYLELDYFDIDLFKFNNVTINSIAVRIYDNELDKWLCYYPYHPNINTIIFESTDNLDKKNLIIYEITKSRNSKERKKVNIVFASKSALTKEEQELFDKLCKDFNVTFKEKPKEKEVITLPNELSNIKELEELKSNISKMSLELQKTYNNKLNEIIKEYNKEIILAKPVYENNIALTLNSSSFPKVNLINKINLLLIDSRVHLSNFGLKICNTINYLETKEEDNIFINVKELLTIINLLDNEEKKKYITLLKNILLKYQNKVKEKTLNKDNYEINLTLDSKPMDILFNEEIDIFRTTLINFINTNSLKINFIKSLEDINNGYYKDKYLYYQSLSNKAIDELFISFIEKAKTKTIEYVVLEFNTYFDNLIVQTEIEVLKESIISNKDIMVKNITHNIDVLNYLTIYSLVKDIKNIYEKYNFNQNIKEEIDNIKNKLINDIINIINNLDSKTALNEVTMIYSNFEFYVNKMKTYEKELVRVREE